MGAMADHFDLESFEMLQDVMEDEFSELLTVYVNDSDQRLPVILQAFRDGDTERLRELAHSFKGSSSNISAAPLAKLCHQLENAARDQQLTGLEPVLTGIESEYAQVRNLLSSLL
ncbi:Hpt domain-containing protein [Bacterioplanoides sp.]|uniref:Hpt domain-containing protein n=1 Tax=Bacterioplanoides sp. TaxID=2066072 RepID=UPI003AFFC30A